MTSRPNKFPGKCNTCGVFVAAEAGTITKVGTGWKPIHIACPAAAAIEAPTFPPTAEQVQALNLFATGGHLAVEAGAGTGKTSTLLLLARQAAELNRNGLYLAFNKSIVSEAARKFPANVTAQTAHSLAYRAHGHLFKDRLAAPRLRPTELARRLGTEPIALEAHDGPKVLGAAFLASLVLRGIEEFCKTAEAAPSERHIPYIEGIDAPSAVTGGRTWSLNNRVRRSLAPLLRKAWADLGRIDGQLPYGHHVYLKQYQLSHPHLDTDFILFDEAQDANPVILAIVAEQAAHAQLVYVGDTNQAIYEFTGAVNALGTIRDAGAAVSFLSQSFRFGPPVADVANGLLERLDAELRITGVAAAGVVGPIATPDCILTRTNAVAVRKVLEAQEAGRRACLVGGGPQEVAFAKAAQLLQVEGHTSHPDLACFDSWGEVQDYVRTDASGGDLALLVRLIDDFGAQAIITALSNLTPEADADVVISTAHKAKGREWDSVALADDFAKVEKKDGTTAELNPAELRLLYVAVTRARRDLDLTSCPQALAGPQ